MYTYLALKCLMQVKLDGFRTKQLHDFFISITFISIPSLILVKNYTYAKPNASLKGVLNSNFRPFSFE